MGGEIILNSWAVILVLISVYILFELIRINSKLNMWYFESLMAIPVIIAALYVYMILGSPSFEFGRSLVRFVFSVSLGIGAHVTYSYSRFLRRGKH